MKGVKKQMRLVRKIVQESAVFSLPALHYREPITRLADYIEK